MEYETKSTCFKNASIRNTFTREVMGAFEAAQSHVELIMLYEAFEHRFKQMEAGNEFDVMALDIINARYRGLHTRLDEEEDRLEQLIQDHNIVRSYFL